METYTDKYKLGLCSISFRELSREEIVLLVKNAGLDCIEWGSDVHAKPNDPDALREIADLQTRHGIFCSSYGTYFRIGIAPTCEIYDYIRAAKLLGTNTLRLWCGNKGSAEYTSAERDAVIADCKKLAEIAESENVTLCLECHINTLTDELCSALDIMEQVGSEHFRMYWQPNQFKTHAQNVQYAGQISRFTKAVHVFNWKERDKYPLALAKPAWQEYLGFFDDIPLLLEFMPDNDPNSLVTEAKSLFEIAGR